jgi:hypothetical protein
VPVIPFGQDSPWAQEIQHSWRDAPCTIPTTDMQVAGG